MPRQHIHDKLIEKEKEKLPSTSLTLSQVADAVGFEHPQYFSKFLANTLFPRQEISWLRDYGVDAALIEKPLAP